MPPISRDGFASERIRIGLMLLFISGCQPEESIVKNSPSQRLTENSTSEPPVRELSHEETLAWISQHRAWKRARKTKPIWARAVTADEYGKKFQTADRAIQQAREGAWLCVGIEGEPWFQSPEKIDSKYERGLTEHKQFTFDDAPHEYIQFHPKPDQKNWAAQIQSPEIKGFNIRPGYDPANPLYSPSGGYVLKRDVEDPYCDTPDDVWLVQQGLFESTYEFLND